MDLIYDHAIDKLSIRLNDCAQPNFADEPYIYLTPDVVYYWKSHYRRLEIFNADIQLTTKRPYQPDTRELAVREWLGPVGHRIPGQSLPIPRMPYHPPPQILPFGDRVFGLASEDGVQFWFFDPNFTPDIPGAEPFLAIEDS